MSKKHVNKEEDKKSDEDDSSSSDSLVEIFKIPGSDYIRKSQIADLDIRSLVVRCTVCLHQINHHDPSHLKRHRRLNILTCNDCYKFYGDSEFSQDEAGNYNYCTWCGNGGTLFVCDFCPNAFCNNCVRRNFGRKEVSVMRREGWKCYVCNPKKLKPKVAYCDLIIKYCKEALKRQEKKKSTGAAEVPDVKLTVLESKDWVLPIFDQLNESCKGFLKNLDKLKQIGVSDNKNLKKVMVKMELIINSHKTELNRTMKSLSNQYTLYVNDRIKADERKKKLEAKQENGNLVEMDDLEGPQVCKSDDERSPTNVPDNSEVKNGLIFESSSDDDTNVNDKSKSEKRREKVNSDLENGSSPVTDAHNATEVKEGLPKSPSEDPNYIAKMVLLSDTSDSESENSVHIDKDIKKTETDKESFHTISATVKSPSDEKTPENSPMKDDSQVTASLPSTEEKLKEPSDESTPCTEEKLEKPSGESTPSTKEKLKKASRDNSPSSEEKVKKPSQGSKGKKEPKLTPVKKRVNRVLFSDSDSSEKDSLIGDCVDRLINSSGDEQLSNNLKIKNKPSKGQEIDMTMSIENDPKLEQQCFVTLEKCDYLLPNNETTVPVPAKLILDELDKEIDSLCKLPSKLGKKKQPSESNREKKKHTEKKAPASRIVSDDDSGSICLSSDDESSEDNKKSKMKDPNFIAKKEFSASSSEEDGMEPLSSDIEEVEAEAPKKTKKAREKNDDSSDDFRPSSKKRKFDKLLSKRISSSDEGKSKKIKDPESNTKSKAKKRRLVLTSDEDKEAKGSSDSSSTSSESDSDNKKKKKKRIKKRAQSSSDDSVKEIPEPSSTPGKGRRDIKKIIHEKDLTQETKNAQQAEKERKKRVQDRQQAYNVFQGKKLEGIENKLTKFVLEVDPESKEEVVEIDPLLVPKLKLHQIKGVKFMWECTIESLKELNESKGSGCILAHCMGLGKTLQVITFLHTCMTNREVKKKIRTAMVICPYNTVLNWRREFDKWLGEVEADVPVHELTVAKDNPTRFDILKYWKRTGGVLILSYDIFRRLAAKKITKLSAKNRDKLQELLINPGADIVICDEGHILKNIKSAISNACLQIGTARRIVLTGTPLQNNLEEYHCMLSFVKPHLLGTLKEFRNRFVHPITNGQYDDSSERDVKRMKKRIHILHKLLDGCVQRCDYSALTKFLPPKYEFVIGVKLSEVQTKMYKWYLENLSKARNEAKIQGGTLFQDYNVLRNLCAHPYIVHTSFQQVLKRRVLKDDDEELSDFINDESEESEAKSKSAEDSDGDEEVVRKYKTRSYNPQEGEESSEEEQEKKEWYFQFINENDSRTIELSGKMILLVEILKECEAVGDKLVLFSQSLLTLDSIEEILEHIDEQPVTEEEKKRDIMCRWVKNLDYFRMDGGTSADFRKSFIDRFNDPANDRARLFLVSTRAGGLGTNLVGANRVIMFDVSWNPSHDVQAIFRVYRFGQLKPVYIYRFLGQGTMEEKIYDRQVNKLSLSIRVCDEQQIDRHFNAAELAELYKFEPEIQRERPTPLLPKDTLLAEMLIKLKDWIVTYHEHDSLLENKTEEDLTEEERQAAWNEYENEREGRGSDYYDINEEIAEYLKEPDFNLAHYEGTVIPSCKQMIEMYIKTLKTRFPTDDVPTTRKKLLLMVTQLIAAFREKHVKILRIKQEYCAKGSVPSTVNKYLEELTTALTELNSHCNEIRNLVSLDLERAAELQRQMFIRAQAAKYYANARANMNPTMNPNFMPQYSRMPQANPANFQFAGTYHQQFQNQPRPQTVASMLKRNQNNTASDSSSSNVKGTVITEVNDDSILLEEVSTKMGEVQEVD